MPKTPSYRKRKGYDQAIVTLTDSLSGRRKDYWLGQYESPASNELYHRVIAAWMANARRLPALDTVDPPSSTDGSKVKELISVYWCWAKGYYRPMHVQSIKGALRLLRKFHGETPATAFGPNALRALREEMVRGDKRNDPPRRPWCRNYVNAQTSRIRHLFKWCAARELIPASVHQALCTLESLKLGKSDARESAKVEPVSQQLLDATISHLCRPVRAVVELQLLTGARPGELLGLRPMDIERDDQSDVWRYRPTSHKTAHRGRDRVIYLGPRAQVVLRPFLVDRDSDAFLFSPAEAEADRREERRASRVTPMSCGNRTGSNRKQSPILQPGDRYTTSAYRQSIIYACDRAFPPEGEFAQRDNETSETWLARLEATGLMDELNAWRKAHRWHPNQLRHSAATALRRDFGLEVAQLALGHSSAKITDAVYAERDESKILQIMRDVG